MCSSQMAEKQNWSCGVTGSSHFWTMWRVWTRLWHRAWTWWRTMWRQTMTLEIWQMRRGPRQYDCTACWPPTYGSDLWSSSAMSRTRTGLKLGRYCWKKCSRPPELEPWLCWVSFQEFTLQKGSRSQSSFPNLKHWSWSTSGFQTRSTPTTPKWPLCCWHVLYRSGSAHIYGWQMPQPTTSWKTASFSWKQWQPNGMPRIASCFPLTPWETMQLLWRRTTSARVEKERKEARAKAKVPRAKTRERTKERAKMERGHGRALTLTKERPYGRKALARRAKVATKVAKDPRVEHATYVARWATMQRTVGKESIRSRKAQILAVRALHLLGTLVEEELHQRIQHRWKLWDWKLHEAASLEVFDLTTPREERTENYPWRVGMVELTDEEYETDEF